MARERMKITRPDQTGFGKSVQTGRPKLDAINPEAIKGFKQGFSDDQVTPPAQLSIDARNAGSHDAERSHHDESVPR